MKTTVKLGTEVIYQGIVCFVEKIRDNKVLLMSEVDPSFAVVKTIEELEIESLIIN